MKQSIYKPDLNDAHGNQHGGHRRKATSALRFSFSQDTEEIKPNPRSQPQSHPIQKQLQPSPFYPPTKTLTQSFTNLSFDKPPPSSQTTTHAQLPTAQPIIPTLTLPKKKREGYGFSFSDSMFYDSDDYPDTECDWDSDTARDPGSSDEMEAPSKPVVPQANSFTDVVVVRDIGSFHMAKPQRRLPCTTATREDAVAIKYAARALLVYAESSDIYGGLIERLERMVHASFQKGDGAARPEACAIKLRDFLIRTQEERVETGESGRVVAHEIEWAEWLVRASGTGVMHVKGAGCKCRPDWEE
jgi:hypothetical protein